MAEKLKAAEDNKGRALSMAEQTKRGHVYIISSIGLKWPPFFGQGKV